MVAPSLSKLLACAGISVLDRLTMAVKLGPGRLQ